MIKPRHLLAAFACLLLAACGQSALVEEQPDTDTATLLITALDRYGIDALQQAADSGEAEAMRLLGNCRFLGLEACGGFDREEGGRLLLAASQAGSVRAQTDMCRTWMDRLPEPEDQAEAIGLCRAALDAGDNEARALLPLYALRGVTAACEVFPDGE
ncbi:MAG: hypothetical protein KDE15_15570, partial [Erythrobacter sp.]|nr:hypothetical protein [Erythrobacter sp.]